MTDPNRSDDYRVRLIERRAEDRVPWWRVSEATALRWLSHLAGIMAILFAIAAGLYSAVGIFDKFQGGEEFSTAVAVWACIFGSVLCLNVARTTWARGKR